MTTASIKAPHQHRSSTVTWAIAGYAVALAAVGLATVVLAGTGHWTAYIPLILAGAVSLVAVGAGYGGVSATFAVILSFAIAGLALAGTASALPMAVGAIWGSPEISNATTIIARAATAVISIVGVLAVAAAWLSDARPRA